MITQFKRKFSPKWHPPQGEFSQWHYRFAQRTSYKQFYYDKPVVVLTDASSASASDGFASALSLLPQVTLIGEPTAGMSGANRSVSLKNSKLKVKLSSMASFRPNGQLFEGNGVEVDHYLMASTKDYTNGQDSVLVYAYHYIHEQAKSQ